MRDLSPETIAGLRDSVAKDQEAALLLDSAARFVDRGWTQTYDAVNRHGVSVPPHSPQAVCWCMRGALLRGCVAIGIVELIDTGRPFFDAVDVDRERTTSIRGRAFRAAAVAALGHEPSQLASLPAIITNWNDTTALSGETVARRLRAAAATVRRRIREVERGIADAERRQPGGAS